VFFAVIATTAVLIAVFVPIAFLPSAAGRLFREFGFVLAFAVGISSFVSLSIVPALAAKLLRTEDGKEKEKNRLAEIGLRLQGFYIRTLNSALDQPKKVLFVTLAAGAVGCLLYFFLPQNLLPSEDRGLIEVRLTGPDGVGLEYVDRQVNEVEHI